MRKMTVIVAGGVGYVLEPAPDGERYEQIRGMAMKVKGNPKVQATAHKAADAAKEAAIRWSRTRSRAADASSERSVKPRGQRLPERASTHAPSTGLPLLGETDEKAPPPLGGGAFSLLPTRRRCAPSRRTLVDGRLALTGNQRGGVSRSGSRAGPRGPGCRR